MANENGPLVIGVGEILWDLLPAGRQLGGAPANFAFHARQLGARGAVVSRVGEDALGKEILQRLESAGVDHSGVGVDPAHPTGVVEVTLDEAGVPTYVIRTGVAWDYIEPTAVNLELAKSADAICFGTLGAAKRRVAGGDRGDAEGGKIGLPAGVRRESSAGVLQRRIARRDAAADGCAEAQRRRIADAGDAAGDPQHRGPHGGGAGRSLFDYARGPDVRIGGAHIYGVDSRHSYPGVACDVADTVGAGDAFTAALVMGLLAGREVGWINAFANRLAAYVCSQHGAMPAISAELRAEWEAQNPRKAGG